MSAGWIEPLGDGTEGPPPVDPDELPPPKVTPRRMHPKVAAVWEHARDELAAVDITTRDGRLEAIRITSRAERLARSLKRALRHDRRAS